MASRKKTAYTVLKRFKDARTGEMHEAGDVITITATRAKEINSVRTDLIEPAQTETTETEG